MSEFLLFSSLGDGGMKSAYFYFAKIKYFILNVIKIVNSSARDVINVVFLSLGLLYGKVEMTHFCLLFLFVVYNGLNIQKIQKNQAYPLKSDVDIEYHSRWFCQFMELFQ